MDFNVVSNGTHGRGETWFDREISKAQYMSAFANGGKLTKDDECKILTAAERFGYGATTSRVFKSDGRYYVHCHRYNSCD